MADYKIRFFVYLFNIYFSIFYFFVFVFGGEGGYHPIQLNKRQLGAS